MSERSVEYVYLLQTRDPHGKFILIDVYGNKQSADKKRKKILENLHYKKTDIRVTKKKVK